MANALRIEPGRMRLGSGKFDTNNRYIRRVAVSANKVMSLSRGSSIAVATATSGGGDLYIAFRWQVGSATIAFSDGNVTAPATGFNTEVPIAV